MNCVFCHVDLEMDKTVDASIILRKRVEVPDWWLDLLCVQVMVAISHGLLYLINSSLCSSNFVTMQAVHSSIYYGLGHFTWWTPLWIGHHNHIRYLWCEIILLIVIIIAIFHLSDGEMEIPYFCFPSNDILVRKLLYALFFISAFLYSRWCHGNSFICFQDMVISWFRNFYICLLIYFTFYI